MASLPLPSYRVRVSPAVLRWARETAGLSLEDASHVAGISTARLMIWEEGTEEAPPPTVAQLRTLSQRYRRPISVFLLEDPPDERLSATYARRLHGATAETGSRHLRFAVRDACEQRAIALDLLTQLDEAPPQLVVAPIDPQDTETSGSVVREVAGVSDQTLLEWAERGTTLQFWIDRLDALGVLVTQFRFVEVEERRGFSIVELPLPLIALNESDARVARLFTLLHEFAHIQRAANGLAADDEVWCNAVAAAALVPAGLAQMVIEEFQGSWEDLGLLVAARFGVSREAAYRRLATLGVISEAQYQQARATLASEPRVSGGGFVPYPAGEVRRLGRQYIRVVGDAYDSGTISLYEASRYLGVQGRYVEPLVAAAERGSAAA